MRLQSFAVGRPCRPVFEALPAWIAGTSQAQPGHDDNKPPKRAAVALANKMARIAWKLTASGERYARGGHGYRGRNDDCGSTQMQFALDALDPRPWADQNAGGFESRGGKKVGGLSLLHTQVRAEAM
ncbi:MAG TPA: hypothetical protein VGL12_12120 [Roseiarcus sp.]